MTKINSELKICIFCGARPNFMKVAPIIRILKRNIPKDGMVEIFLTR